MKSGFAYSDDNKRYHTLSYHLKHKFGEKVYKAVIDAGFSCPNIDGTLSDGGCSFCLGGSGAFTHGSALSVTEQLKLENERIIKKYGEEKKLIAYFQAHTNTHAPVDVLREKFYSALELENVCGISVATRPDCLEDEKISLLSELNEKTYLTVELGLQTVSDISAKMFNRGYGFDVFCDAFKRLKNAGIRVCVHIINGLYCEDEDMCINTAKTVGEMGADAVKISLLHVLRGTPYEKLYRDGWYIPLTKEKYIDILCRQLTYLPPECVVERVTGDGAGQHLIAPDWSRDKISVIGGIDKRMAELNLFQGDNFKKQSECV